MSLFFSYICKNTKCYTTSIIYKTKVKVQHYLKSFVFMFTFSRALVQLVMTANNRGTLM